MKRNVIVLLGVNGVGKSTLAQELSKILPESVVLSGSTILMQVFGGLTRPELELLSPSKKMQLMVPAFVHAFEKHHEARHLILDTHLVVCIRRSGVLTLERVWSPLYHPYLEHVFLIMSPAQDILERRKRDLAAHRRERDLEIRHIQHDQEINRAAFQELIASNLPSSIIINREHHLTKTVAYMQKQLTVDAHNDLCLTA